METIRKIVKVGNSAGVILPRDWYGGEAKVELVERPVNIDRDIFEILKEQLYDVVGIYLVGSYARNEETKESDIDILVISKNTNTIIKRGKYNILVVSKKELINQMKKNIMPLLPMILEARAIINASEIEIYKDFKVGWQNLEWYVEVTKSSIDICTKLLDLSEDFVSDRLAYSVILSLRSAYLVDCIIKSKKWTNKEFLSIVKNESGSLNAYSGYLRVKNNKPIKEEVSSQELKSLISYISNLLMEQEKWAKRKK